MPTEAEELSILSAIWVMASNDDTSLISYEGIRRRLHLPSDIYVKSLIRSHGELFRLGYYCRTPAKVAN